MTSPAAAWAQAKSVLCIRLDNLGDVVMTTPALRALAETGGGRRLTLLTSRSGAAVAPLIPYVRDVIEYQAPWLKATAPRITSASDWAMAAHLRAMQFDAAVIFTTFSQSALPAALLCFLADIPLRLAHARENPYQLVTDWVADPEPAGGIRHEVERQLALVEHIGARTSDTRLALDVPEPARAAARRLLARLGIADHSPWIVLHPGATAPSRRYPPEQFAVAARSIARQTGARVLVTGDASEHALVDAVCAHAGRLAIPLGALSSVGELAALIEAAPLLVTNNTGPAHIAAAVGTPVVDLYALTNPQHTPWQVPHRVLSFDVPCRNCFKSVCPFGHNDCLRRVTPDQVAAAALELLSMQTISGAA